LDDINNEFVASKFVNYPEDKKSNGTIYVAKIRKNGEIRIPFTNPDKYLIEGKPVGRKGKLSYYISFNLTDVDVSSKNIYVMQELGRRSDIMFPFQDKEAMTIPSHYFTQKGKYPLKNYEVWELDGFEYVIFNEDTKLNMFSFYTDGNYKITRVDNQLLLCNQPTPKPILVNNTTQVNNTQVACRKNNVFDMIREVKTFQNKLNENNMESLECFLVSTKSIPIFFEIIQENINKTDELYNIKIDYNPEKNVKIYYGFEECKSILEENNNEINEFIIVGDRFFELMKIDKGEKVTIVKDNELKIIFKGEKDKITLVFKSNICIYFFPVFLISPE